MRTCLLLLAAGCATSPPRAPTPPPPGTSAEQTEGLILVDAGIEPRQELRLRPAVGQRRRVVVTLQLVHRRADLPPGPLPPPVHVNLDTEVLSRSADGELEFSFRVAKVDVPDRPDLPQGFAAKVRELAAEAEGAVGQAVRSERGLIRRVEVHTGSPSVATYVQALGSPFPKEPVGPGARWEVHTVQKSGLTIRGKTSYELLKLDDRTATVRFTLVQDSEGTGLPVPFQGDASLTPLSHHARGEGRLEQDLGELAPRSSTTTITSSARLRSTRRTGQVTEQTLDVETRLSVESQAQP